MFKPILTAIILSAGLAHAAVEERLVEYKAGDTLCEGVAITDSNTKENKPGVLIVHQWTGISDHEKEAAKRLAAMGYSVFLADVYCKGVRPPGRVTPVQPDCLDRGRLVGPEEPSKL
jgi:dienelactone hydrolase